VRIDRGKDFLSATVASVLAGFAVRVGPLPGYTPHLKGSVETVNGASERMFAAGLPRYTHAQRQASGRPVDPDAPALRFEAFVAELLAWVAWWNTGNVMPALQGRTPLQAWLADPTTLTTVPAADLRLLMLEDDGRTRKITTEGVAWRARQYAAAWMTGQAGREVRLRHMPHHEHEVEVFDARSGEHLGAAFLADQASPEQIAQVHRSRELRRRRLQADLRAAEKARRIRYAAATTAVPPQPVTAVTAAEAAAELADAGDRQLRAEARPALMPPRPPAPGWVLPRAPARAEAGEGRAR
jgi:putative transposase